MSRIIFMCFVLFTLVQWTSKSFARESGRPGQDYALFFANDDYSANPKFADLRNPVRDVQAISDELQQMYGFSTAVHRNKTKQEIYNILQRWQQKHFSGDDQLFIFFSGHGTFNDFEKTGYFIPRGSGSDYGDYIDLTKLGNIVTEIDCPHILLAIDACYSGTIDQEIAFKGFGGRPATQKAQRDVLIQRQLRNKSRLLITSGGKERTPDGQNHSPFAGAILKGLKNAYSNGDGLLIFPDLIGQLECVNPRPHRGELMGHNAGGFVFVAQNGQHMTSSRPVKEASPGGSAQLTEDFGQIASIVVDQDGNSYPFRRMKDGKYWLTKNLNVEVRDSYCYEKDPGNCQKYGRLYTWEAAKEACAALGAGWRLPTSEEWHQLSEGISADKTTANDVMIILRGGFRDPAGGFGGVESEGCYWSSSLANNGTAWFYSLFYDRNYLTRDQEMPDHGHSVRCVRD